MSESIEVRDYSLAAGVPLDIEGAASFFQLMSASANIDVEFFRNNSRNGSAISVPASFRYGPLGEGREFHRVRLKSATSQTVKVCVATSEANLSQLSGTVTIGQGTGITDVAPASVGVAAASVLAAGSGRHRVMFKADDANTGSIAIGGAGVTLANSTIVLLAGDTYIESDSADAEFFAIASIAAQTLRIQSG